MKLDSLTYKHNFSFQASSSQLTQLEEDILLQDVRITVLETNAYTMYNTSEASNSTRIANLESVQTANQNRIFNNTFRIKQLETLLYEQNANLSKGSIRITDLESELAKDIERGNVTSKRLRLLEEDMTAELAISQNHSTLLNQIDSAIIAVKDLVKNQNDAIDDLQIYTHTINSSWHEYTRRLGNTEVAMNSFEASLGNHSLLISDLDYSRQEEISINQAQNIHLQDLELDVNLTQYALQTYTATL